MPLDGMFQSLFCRNMKKIKSKTRNGTFYQCKVNKLIVKPLARKIKNHEIACLREDAMLLDRLEEVDKKSA
jgi:hypothetical protein